jgi:hypothetical protein
MIPIVVCITCGGHHCPAGAVVWLIRRRPPAGGRNTRWRQAKRVECVERLTKVVAKEFTLDEIRLPVLLATISRVAIVRDVPCD